MMKFLAIETSIGGAMFWDSQSVFPIGLFTFCSFPPPFSVALLHRHAQVYLHKDVLWRELYIRDNRCSSC